MFSIFYFFQFCGVAQMAAVHKYSKPILVIHLQDLEVLNLKTKGFWETFLNETFGIEGSFQNPRPDDNGP